MDTLRAEGTLRITDTCVYLEAFGELYLLIWRSDQTTWAEETRAITVENFDGSIATANDGDAVVVGGSGGEDDSGESSEESWGRMEWVVPPDPSCSHQRWWDVGSLADIG